MDFTSDYYYGNEAEQYIFYRIPKALFIEPQFKKLSCDAKVLYGLMIDRIGLSIKNNWRDKQNKIYIYFTLEDTQEYMNCGHTKGVKIIAELEAIGLIERVKQGQGKPTKIYVKKFFTSNNNTYIQKSTNNPHIYPQENQDFLKEEVHTSTKEKSRVPQIGSADFLKADTNNNEFNNTEFNNSKSKSCPYNNNIDPDFDSDDYIKYQLKYCTNIDDKYKQLENQIKEQINYELLITMKSVEKNEVDAFILIIIDTLLSNAPTIRINGEDKPQAVVKSMLTKIDCGCIIYCINKFKEQNHEIKYKKNYLLTCLYNAKMESVYNGINYLKQIGASLN